MASESPTTHSSQSERSVARRRFSGAGLWTAVRASFDLGATAICTAVRASFDHSLATYIEPCPAGGGGHSIVRGANGD